MVAVLVEYIRSLNQFEMEVEVRSNMFLLSGTLLNNDVCNNVRLLILQFLFSNGTVQLIIWYSSLTWQFLTPDEIFSYKTNAIKLKSFLSLLCHVMYQIIVMPIMISFFLLDSIIFMNWLLIFLYTTSVSTSCIRYNDCTKIWF